MKLFLFILAFTISSCSQDNSRYEAIDLSGFDDSARHWYGVREEQRIIEPLPDQTKYKPEEITKIADNIILFQKNNGGWAKNYDMQAILTDEQKDAVLKAKNETNTTFDNGATHSQVEYLAKVYSFTKIEKYKEACIKGIEFILNAQYPNGGFPQFYPDTNGYRKHITFNDGAMMGVMNLLQKIAENEPEFAFIDSSIRERVKAAFENGIDCILNCQIEQGGILTAWCQQHDHTNFEPQGARAYELPSITNGESVGIVKFLMRIENPDKRIINSVQSAVRWFEKSKIYGIKLKWIEAPHTEYKHHSTSYDVVVVEDLDAPPIWARFYELETLRPLFSNRDGKAVYSMDEVERERRTGYAWYVYDPQEALDLYPEWQKKWTPLENVLKE
jgi:PelA/Pel-15E family pectate lyase